MTANKPGDPTTLNRLYGRAKGKPLRKGQQALVDTLLPQIAVPADGPVTAERLFGDLARCISRSAGGGDIWRGRRYAARSRLHRGRTFLNGVAQALTHTTGMVESIHSSAMSASTTATR
jgi:tRNA (guanine-N7-)-methyltransferase